MANILKQIKIGNTTYNIEPVTAYLPLYDLGNTTFKVTRGASQSTKNTGYWAGMLNSGQEGSPTLPSTGAWWHVISMDWTSVDSNNWISQLALPTQHGGVPHYRRNNATDTSIDSSTWHAFITDENIGSQSVSYASNAGWAKANDVYDWAKASSKPTYTKSEIGLGNVDNTADANKNVNYANSAGSVAWDNISSKPITITQRNNDSPVSGAYTWGTYVTMRNANNWFEIYAPHMGTSSDRVYMQTGWDNDRQGWKAIAWTSDIPTSLPANDVYAWAKSPTKPSYTKSEVGLGNVDNTADANKSVNYATSSHLLRSYSASNSSHGGDYYLKCRHNVDGNDRFKLQIIRSDGSVTHSTSVDYANSAGSVAWGNIGDKPSTFPTTVDSSLSSSSTNPVQNTVINSAIQNIRNSISGLGSALNNKADSGHTHPVDSSLSSTSSNPVKNSAIYSAFSSTVGFDYDYYSYGEMGSWRLLQYHATGNTLDIRHGVLTINAQEKTYGITFANPFNSNTYVIVCGIYRDNRNSWFWSPLITKRTNKGFNVYVKGNTSGDNSGTLFYIAIRSN